MGLADSIDNSPIKRVVQVDAGGVPVYAATGSSFNDVDVTNLPTTVDTNSGNKSASTLRAVIATDQPQLTNPLKVEEQFSYSRKTSDGQVKSSAGFVHTVSIAPLTATPTAGLLTIYDDPAETGTVLYAEWIFATDVGHSITLDTSFANGLYVGFDGTLANVQVTVAYR